MLWVGIYFSTLALDILQRGLRQPPPIAVSAGAIQRPLIFACNAQASALGVRCAMSVSAARALASELRVYPRNESAEQSALEAAAAWAGQFTPAVAIIAGRGLVLEISASVRLFGGAAAIVRRLERGLRMMGYRVALALAPSAHGAWLLARHNAECMVKESAPLVFESAALKQRLAALPVGLLDQPEASIALLHALGVRTLKECWALPRAGLLRRFGQGLLDEIDRALGKLPDTRPWFASPPKFAARLELPAESSDSEALLFAARRLLVELEGYLRARGAGVQRFELDCQHADGTGTSIAIGLAANGRAAAHWRNLLRERLVRVTLPAPVRALLLRADDITPHTPENASLFPDARSAAEDAHVLLERLRARLGSEAVHWLTVAADHRPEFAWRACAQPDEKIFSETHARPLALLYEPRALEVDGATPIFRGRLTLLTGPERIESGWWDAHDIKRDYFIARNEHGEELWVFSDRHGSWFLHGVFA